MQETVSNAEIEDVLSSIRRLVSQNGGATLSREGGSTSGASAAPPAEPLGMFLLTPDYRIGDPENPANAPATDASDRRAGGAVAEDTPPQSSPARAEVTSSLQELERTVLELESAISETGADWEPDGSEEPDEEAAATIPLPHLYRALSASGKPRTPQEAQPAADAGHTGNEFTSSRHRMTAGTAPAVPETEAESATRPAPAAPLSAAGASFAADAGEGTSGAPERNDLSPEPVQDSLPDSEMLRALVAEIVRQELKGELGQRITRNVRKLVRREIYRALESRRIE